MYDALLIHPTLTCHTLAGEVSHNALSYRNIMTLKENEWAEDLPSKCPPKTAIIPQYQTFYRLVKQFPPTEEDFYSHRKLYPNKYFKTNECRVHSLSIFSSLKEKIKK